MNNYSQQPPIVTIIKPTPISKSQFMSHVYNWMVLGILFTALVAYYVASQPGWTETIFGNKLYFFGLVVLQLGMVFLLSACIDKLSSFFATFFYLLYAGLVGLTCSIIFIRFTETSIVSAFLVTTFGFSGLSLFGYITKRDLGPWGSFCGMGLFGLVGVGILSFFVPSLMGDVSQKVISVIGIIVFSGLTAYDTQKIKELSEDSVETKKKAIHGALLLYLDFINLFLNILRLYADNK